MGDKDEFSTSLSNFKCNSKTSKILTFHVEVAQQRTSLLQKEELIGLVECFVKKLKLVTFETVFQQKDLPTSMQSHVAQIHISSEEPFSEIQDIEVATTELVYYPFRLESDGPSVEELGGEEVGDEVPAATHWLLPSEDLLNLWDTLIYDSNIKEQLLRFVNTTMLFSDKGVDDNIITWNRVLLLHGPPGTGKTSLCKALAQKLSIRLSNRYQYGVLLEVNSHSLFSKWFSESGKLVQKMFSKITELVEDPESLVFVLIDEVESLTKTRMASSNGSDPSDALRVVNALLTQIDQLKRYPNVLVLTTSNVTGSIDLAFVDRADIKQYIGLPSQAAIYQIYFSCLTELMKKNIITPHENLLTFQQVCRVGTDDNCSARKSRKLWAIAELSVGLSGRVLRKIPFLAHALHIKSPTSNLQDFLQALADAVMKHKQDSDKLNESS